MFKSVVFGGIIAFVWGFISWMVIPWHQFNAFEAESMVSEVIMHNAPASGMYTLPNYEKVTKMTPGTPFVFAAISRGGVSKPFWLSYVISFITQLLGALFITWLLRPAAKSLGYFGRVGFVTLVGLTIGVLHAIPSWNWWQYPPSYSAVIIFDSIITWFLAGLAMAACFNKKFPQMNS